MEFDELLELTKFDKLLKLTKEDFDKVEHRDYHDTIICDSFVIIPLDEAHDSGFNCIELVAMLDDEPVCKCSGWSDVINLDGIGGYGDWVAKDGVPRSLPIRGWSIDCLPCGYLRLFCNEKMYIKGYTGSNAEIYVKED